MHGFASKEQAFELACYKNNLEMAKALEKMGADPHHINKIGVTPTLLSFFKGHEKLKKIYPLNDYEKQHLNFKLLSHWFHYYKEVSIERKINSKGTQGTWMYASVAESLQSFCKWKGFQH